MSAGTSKQGYKESQRRRPERNMKAWSDWEEQGTRTRNDTESRTTVGDCCLSNWLAGPGGLGDGDMPGWHRAAQRGAVPCYCTLPGQG